MSPAVLDRRLTAALVALIGSMQLITAVAVAVIVASITVGAADFFLTTWKAPEAKALTFGGRPVAAVVIVDDEALQISAEEALAREISARGPIGTPAYRFIPREERASAERAKAWFQNSGMQGAVIVRVVGAENEKVYSSMIWSSGYYSDVWNYYGYGWATATPIGPARNELTITVETLLYDMSGGGPIWAGVSRTKNPKDPRSFMQTLAKNVGKELEKAGLARRDKS